MISIHELDFQYDQSDVRLRMPELEIEQSAKVAMGGPGGSGKTTLRNLIAGISVPVAGCIIAQDVNVSSMTDAKRRDFRIRNIGLVFQEFELLDHLTVQDNILLTYRICTESINTYD